MTDAEVIEHLRQRLAALEKGVTLLLDELAKERSYHGELRLQRSRDLESELALELTR